VDSHQQNTVKVEKDEKLYYLQEISNGKVIKIPFRFHEINLYIFFIRILEA
jgi:hypothetical protein